MEIYWFEPEKFQQLYNCSAYSVDQVPLEQRQRTLLGTLSLTLFVLFEVLYIPCIFAIWRHLKQSCYKIMFAIGIVDILGLFVPGLLSGLLGIQGAVFCSCPGSIYWAGVAGNFFYGFETMGACLLALNRCLEMSSSKVADFLFKDLKTWIWLGLVCLYACYYCFFDNSILFSSVTYTWIFNPHVGYLEGMDDLYKPLVDFLHEPTVSLSMLLFYAFFIYFLLKNQKLSAINSSEATVKTRKIVFLQIFLLSAINSAATISYVLLPFFNVGHVVFIVCGNFGWLLVHGIPPLIYLGINKTLRQDCLQMLKAVSRRREKHQNSVMAITVVLPAIVGKPTGAEQATNGECQPAQFRQKTFTF